MNKSELVAAMAAKSELSKKDAEKALKAFTEVVSEKLKKGEKIQLVGFGTFETTKKKHKELAVKSSCPSYLSEKRKIK